MLNVGYSSALPSIIEETPGLHIEAGASFPPGFPSSAFWAVRPGYVVCSARVQLADGSTAGPTTVLPYPMPLPLGGQYDETSDPATHFTAVKITAAKSPVPLGASCNNPLQSTSWQTLARRGPRPAVETKVIEVSPTTLRLAVTPRKPGLVLCPKADIKTWQLDSPLGAFVRPLYFTVAVKPHGGLSSIVTMPPNSFHPGEATDPKITMATVYFRRTPSAAHNGKKQAATLKSRAATIVPTR